MTVRGREAMRMKTWRSQIKKKKNSKTKMMRRK
jgi:hypothetical protein